MVTDRHGHDHIQSCSFQITKAIHLLFHMYLTDYKFSRRITEFHVSVLVIRLGDETCNVLYIASVSAGLSIAGTEQTGNECAGSVWQCPADRSQEGHERSSPRFLYRCEKIIQLHEEQTATQRLARLSAPPT